MPEEITIITGGSAGLGLELAKQHYSNNDNVCILGRSEARLSLARDQISSSSNNGKAEILAYTCNVGCEQEVEKVFKSCSEKYTISNVYNVAGIGAVGRPEDINQDLISDLLEANFVGLVLVSTYALRAMRDSGGNLINVMSTISKRANKNEALYCGVKWGARGYTESLQEAVKGSNINVIAVYPGGMNTGFWRSEHVVTPDLANFMDPAEVAEMVYSNTVARSTLKLSEIMMVRK